MLLTLIFPLRAFVLFHVKNNSQYYLCEIKRLDKLNKMSYLIKKPKCLQKLGFIMIKDTTLMGECNITS